jgi:APA family basic amino acid/polyamine antiporter
MIDLHPLPPSELERSLGLGRATAMVVGTIIGASIFVQPSLVTGAVGTVGGVLLAWGIAGLLTLAGALITAELASACPATGGVYAFLRRAYSPGVGFLWAWAMFWSMHTGIIAALGVVFARYSAALVPLGDAGVRVVAIAAILALSLVNVLGVRLASGVQAAVTAGKLLAIGVLIVGAFWIGGRLPAHFVVGAPAGAAPWSGRLGAAVAAGLFAFGGWHMVTYTAGETRDPARTLPRALIAGTTIVTLTYLGLNAAYLYVLPLDRVAASSRVAADAAEVLLGRGGEVWLAVLVAGSTFGALTGIILMGPRVYYSLARDGLLFRWVAAVHPLFRTPHRAIALQALWAAALVATGTYRALFSRVVYTEWIFFAALAVGLLRLRRREGYRPAYRVPGGMVVPVLFAGCAALVAVSQIVADPGNSAIGLALVLAGWPVYALWTRRRPRAGATPT